MKRSDAPKKPFSGKPSPESPVSRLRSSIEFLTDRNASRNAASDESVSILDGDWHNRIHKRKQSSHRKAVSSKAGPGSAEEKAEPARNQPDSGLKWLMAKIFR